jgi:hypothetical protein
VIPLRDQNPGLRRPYVSVRGHGNGDPSHPYDQFAAASAFIEITIRAPASQYFETFAVRNPYSSGSKVAGLFEISQIVSRVGNLHRQDDEP